MKWLPALHWQIAIALLLAVLVAVTVGASPTLISTTDFVGSLFLRALKMLIVPLIVSAIISGLAAASETAGVGRMGLRTLVYYMATGLFAVLAGMLAINLLNPGIIDGVPAGERLGLAQDTAEVLSRVEGRGASSVLNVFMELVPPNVVAAAANGQMLGLITFSLLFGSLIAQLPKDVGDTQRRFWQGVYDIMTRMTAIVMLFAPIGVFALVTKTVAQTGWGAFKPLLLFFVAVILGLVFHWLVSLSLFLKLVARVHPLQHLKAMAPAMSMAFSTSSSAATLPVTMDCVERRIGVSRRVSSFTLPIGSTVNMDGTALYECAAALFIAQAYGLDLSFTVQFIVVVTALITSIGVAGIPSASLVAIAIILSAIGLPLEGVGLILVVDRVLDMCRTLVNVYSDSVGAVVIGRMEGEAGIFGQRPLGSQR